MIVIDASLARRAEEAHYELQSAVFFGERREISGASVYFAPGISDPEWNHAARIDLGSVELDVFVAELRRLFAARALPATIVVSPSSVPTDLGERLPERGFAPCFRHTWHFLDRSAPAPALEPGPGVDVRVVRSVGDLRAFVGVFEGVYAVNLESGEPEPLDSGYVRCLAASFSRPPGPARVVHYLATVDGAPAGTGTVIHGLEGAARGWSGLYNLAVDPRYRRRGVAAALVSRRVDDARSLGQDVVLLQTERRTVGRRFERYGFTKGFVTTGFAM